MRVLISERAEADLARIYAWLAIHHAPEVAEQFRRRAENAMALLGLHPEVGPHPGWATRHKSLRFWIISRTCYLIYYEVRAEAVSIERVLDGRRDVRRIIQNGIGDNPEDRGG
jgi:plasmid stabilization system protein ParE